MKEKSLAKNSIYYLIYNVLNVLFPFITGIYVARILPKNIVGEVAAAQNIVTYFVILAFLGIPTYGMREISKARKQSQDLNKIFSELVIINFISTCFFSMLYFGLILLVPSYKSELKLYIICGISVVLNALNINWLYDGLEEYRYISLRNVFFKLIVFILLIFLVKDSSDYLFYASLTIIGTAGNYFLNVLHSRKFVKLTFKNLNLKRHMKSIVFLLFVNLAIEVYTLVDITMLKFFSSNESIANYSYGSKINKILLQIVNTFTMVLVPRITLYYKEKRMDEFNKLIVKSLKIIILISIPMIIGIQFVSKFLICKIYGDTYLNSAYILNILSFVLLISPIGYLLGSRTLLVAQREKYMIIAVGIGAIVNVVGNFILIPLYNEFGAAVASVISEFVIAIIYIILGRKIYTISNFWKDMMKISISAITMLCTLLFCIAIENEMIKCIVEIISGIVVYTLMLIILKEDIAVDAFIKIRYKKDN